MQITGVETRQAGRRVAIAEAVEAVTGEAGVGGPAVAAAHGDDLAGLAVGLIGHAATRLAAGHRKANGQGEEGTHPPATRRADHGSGNCQAGGGLAPGMPEGRMRRWDGTCAQGSSS